MRKDGKPYQRGTSGSAKNNNKGGGGGNRSNTNNAAKAETARKGN